MGVGDGIYMYIVVVKKVHVRYLISWWVLVTAVTVSVLNDVLMALRSLSTTAEFLTQIRPRPTTAVKLTWQKLHIAVFIAPLFYEKIGLTLPGHIGVACNTDTDRIGIPESRKNVAWTFCVRG